MANTSHCKEAVVVKDLDVECVCSTVEHDNISVNLHSVVDCGHADWATTLYEICGEAAWVSWVSCNKWEASLFKKYGNTLSRMCALRLRMVILAMRNLWRLLCRRWWWLIWLLLYLCSSWF